MGWASRGEPVSISFLGKLYNITTNDNGKWYIIVSDLTEGGPHKMTISGKNIITLNEIYIGDVWLASGQSNMELPLSNVEPLYEEEIKTHPMRKFASLTSLRFMIFMKDMKI